MDPATQVELIAGLLRSLGVVVRHENLGGDGGGLCQIRGDRVFFVDMDADSATTAERCVKALLATPGWQDLQMPDELRSMLKEEV